MNNIIKNSNNIYIPVYIYIYILNTGTCILPLTVMHQMKRNDSLTTPMCVTEVQIPQKRLDFNMNLQS